jgi:hypothetical protein
MKKVINISILLIAFTSALKWFIAIPFRIQYYDIFIILFILFFSFYFIMNQPKIILKKELKIFILFLLGWLILAILSGSSIIFYGKKSDAYSFYAKGLIQLAVYTIFFILFMVYLSDIS